MNEVQRSSHSYARSMGSSTAGWLCRMTSDRDNVDPVIGSRRAGLCAAQ